jgi:hypothetical protein
MEDPVLSQEQQADTQQKHIRRARADEYFNGDLSGQRDWYDAKASYHKKYANHLGLSVIVCGAATTFVAVLQSSEIDLYNVIIAGLGTMVVLLQGFLRIWRFDETWVEYRKASERMKRERRLYVNTAGPYAESTDEDKRYRAFVEAIEQIIAEEQHIYFKQDPPASDQHGRGDAPSDEAGGE